MGRTGEKNTGGVQGSFIIRLLLLVMIGGSIFLGFSVFKLIRFNMRMDRGLFEGFSVGVILSLAVWVLYCIGVIRAFIVFLKTEREEKSS